MLHWFDHFYSLLKQTQTKVTRFCRHIVNMLLTETSLRGELQPFKNCSEQAVVELCAKWIRSRDAVVVYPSLLALGPIHRLACTSECLLLLGSPLWRCADLALRWDMKPAFVGWYCVYWCLTCAQILDSFEHNDYIGFVLKALRAYLLQFCLKSW